MSIHHREHHRTEKIGWLRAAVLGANDGLISTACLIIGVAAANTSYHEILVAGIAALVAGAMSMAAGEYVSVSSQADNEQAELDIERKELEHDRPNEVNELTQIYIHRGVKPPLARQVAEQLMDHDALGAHARDEIGIMDITRARPLQAAISSAISFTLGAILPLLVAALAYREHIISIVYVAALIFLALLGGVAAHIGGARIMVGIWRVMFWGALAMAISAGLGHLTGVMV